MSYWASEVLVALVLAGCGSPAAPAPATALVATADPKAATTTHVAATVAYLAKLSEDLSGGIDANLLVNFDFMRNTLTDEQAWIGTHAEYDTLVR